MIRDATVSDARAIAAVHVASWDGAYRGLLPDRYLDAMDVERWTNGWRLVLTRERPLGAGTVVAGVGASVVGFADATPSRDDEVADARLTEVQYRRAFWWEDPWSGPQKLSDLLHRLTSCSG